MEIDETFPRDTNKSICCRLRVVFITSKKELKANTLLRHFFVVSSLVTHRRMMKMMILFSMMTVIYL